MKKQRNGSVRSITATHGGSEPSPESSPDEEDAERAVEGRETMDESLDQGVETLESCQEEVTRPFERDVSD